MFKTVQDVKDFVSHIPKPTDAMDKALLSENFRAAYEDTRDILDATKGKQDSETVRDLLDAIGGAAKRLGVSGADGWFHFTDEGKAALKEFEQACAEHAAWKAAQVVA